MRFLAGIFIFLFFATGAQENKSAVFFTKTFFRPKWLPGTW